MRNILAILLVLLPWPTIAGQLQGQWEARLPNSTYKAIMLADSEGRLTMDSPNDGGRPAAFMGYVRRFDDVDLHAILTNRSLVSHLFCRVQSSDLLDCYVARADAASVRFLLVRVGKGPHRLRPR